MQVTSGVRRILGQPFFYSAFQRIMGSEAGWTRISNVFLNMKPGEFLLDVGCGPGDVLNHVHDVEYWGFDISSNYIDKARKRFGARGTFFCKRLEPQDIHHLPKFDAALLSGVLHHLDEVEVLELLELIAKMLKPGGRVVTVDPCFAENQNPIAKFLISRDRGQNVRTQSKYSELARRCFSNVRSTVEHKRWIPYTHCFMICREDEI